MYNCYPKINKMSEKSTIQLGLLSSHCDLDQIIFYHVMRWLIFKIRGMKWDVGDFDSIEKRRWN